MSAAQASPSSRVDLPDPFSPTSRVTGASKRSSCRLSSTGRLKGKLFPLGKARRWTDSRWIMGGVGFPEDPALVILGAGGLGVERIAHVDEIERCHPAGDLEDFADGADEGLDRVDADPDGAQPQAHGRDHDVLDCRGAV